MLLLQLDFRWQRLFQRAGNLGGGGFMLVYIKDRDEIFFIDYRSSSPLNSNLENIFNLSIKSNKQLKSLPKILMRIIMNL